MLLYINNLEYIILTILYAKFLLKYDLHFERWKIILVGGISILVTILLKIAYFFHTKQMLSVITFLTIVIILCIFCKEKLTSILLFAVSFYVSVSMLGQMMRELCNVICHMLGIKWSKDVIDIIVLFVLIIAVYSVANNFRHGLKDVALRYHILLNAIIIIDSICISFLGLFISKYMNADRMWGIELAYIFTILGVFVQIALLIAMILSRDEHKEKEALNAKYLEEQTNHYEYLKNRELETKKFRHDINHQMTLMKTLYREGKIEQFEEILNSVDDRINTFTKHVSVGNDAADAIINQYVREAENAGIKLSVEGHFPPNFHIAAVDICTVFANLLSNAIRAERDANGDEVKLMVRNLDNELFVEVSNHYITEVKRNGERFMSTKKDRANHGLGLQNVYDCVGRNHGVIHITTDNQIFDVKLNLKSAEA